MEREKTPELKMILWRIEFGIRDAVWPTACGNGATERAQAIVCARKWLFTDRLDDSRPETLAWCCMWASLNPYHVRRCAREIIDNIDVDKLSDVERKTALDNGLKHKGLWVGRYADYAPRGPGIGADEKQRRLQRYYRAKYLMYGIGEPEDRYLPISAEKKWAWRMVA